MRIKFWGVRGSLPYSSETLEWANHFKRLMTQFFQNGHSKSTEIDLFLADKSVPEIGGYGSATTCVQISSGQNCLIIDGGSGLKKYNDDLMKNSFSQAEHHILMTHFHFDHTMGIPYFTPHFLKGHKIHYYSPDINCEKYIRALFQKPTFPVPFELLSAEIIFHHLKPYEKYQIQNFTVQAFSTDHSDACYGYKVTSLDKKTYSHAVDNEIIRQSADDLKQDAGLYQNTNILYIDAQYSEEDVKNKKGWGHGTFDRAFEICRHFNIEQVFFGHHDPSYDREDIQKMSEKTKLHVEKNHALQKIKWQYVYDGLVVQL